MRTPDTLIHICTHAPGVGGLACECCRSVHGRGANGRRARARLSTALRGVARTRCRTFAARDLARDPF